MFGVEQKVEAAARKAALFSASALLALVGLAFLTGAAWVVLADLKSPAFAAALIGVIYIGFACISGAFALSAVKRPRPRHSAAQDLGGLSPLQLIVVSFLQGIEQGARSKRQP